MSKILNRFLKYVSYETTSNEESKTVPSSKEQLEFGKYLEQELKDLGLSSVVFDDKGYLYATLPSNIDKTVPTIGFIAHMDTSPDMSGKM